MNKNYSANQLRPPPPLIRMNKSSPRPCAISTVTKTTKQPNFNVASDHRPFTAVLPLNPPTKSQQTSTVQTISTSHNSTNHLISSSPPPPPYPSSSKRKRKAGGSNGELINMVKKQLQQLNRTLAALETAVGNDELSSDEERSHPAQLPNDSLPHQPLQRRLDNQTTVGVETEGFTLNIKPISRPEPRWSNRISIDNPANSSLLPAGHLSQPDDAEDTIPGRQFLNLPSFV